MRSRYVTRERSLLLRFAANRPTQATAVDDVDGRARGACATATSAAPPPTRRRRGRAARTAPRRAARAAEAAAAAGPGATRASRRPAPTRAARRPRPRDRRARPGAPAARALADRVRAAASGTASRRTASGPPARGASARSRRARARGQPTATTDAFMKVICIAPGGRSGYAAAGERGRRATSTPAPWPSGPPRRRPSPGAAGRAAARRVPGGASSPTPSACCSSCSATPPSTGSPTPRAAARSWAGSGSGWPRPRSTSPTRPATRAPLPRAFDAEGTPKRPVPLIQDGVAHRVVHDMRSARAGRRASRPATRWRPAATRRARPHQHRAWPAAAPPDEDRAVRGRSSAAST